MQIKCKCCGKVFEGYHTQKYCSIRCRNYFLKNNIGYPESGIRKCKYCGKEYYYSKGQDNWYKNTKSNIKDSGKSSIHFCCYECGVKFTQKQTEISVQNKYRVNNISKLKEVKIKKENTCLKNHGVKNPMHSKSIKEKNLYKKQLQENKRIKKVKNTWKNKTKKEIQKINNKRKNTCLQKYKVSTVFETDKLKFDKNIQTKRIISKKKNGTINSSIPEKQIKKLLKTKFEKVKYQYKSNAYPFNCDFYVPKLDLYIEYQGHWTHGLHPFKSIAKDRKILKEWQEKSKRSIFYENAIDVWTRRDPYKRKVAKKNKLNWIEFFNMKQFLDWYNKV